MSPEQIRGDTIDPRTDVFSLGCILYEMLYGKPLFTRSTVHDTDAATLSDPVPMPPPADRLTADLGQSWPVAWKSSRRGAMPTLASMAVPWPRSDFGSHEPPSGGDVCRSDWPSWPSATGGRARRLDLELLAI